MDNSALQQRPADESLLASVAGAAQALLTAANLEQAINRALETVGRALDVDRVCVFERHIHPQTEESLVSRQYEWVRGPSLPMAGAAIVNISLQGSLPRWHAAFAAGEAIEGAVRELPAGERAFIEPFGSKAILVVPILMQERWMGLLFFHDCRRERLWSASEKAILRTLAACLGGAMSRRRSEAAAKASIRKYRSLFDTSRDGIVITTLDGRIEDANRAYLDMLGYSFEEVTALTYQQLTPVQWAKRDGDVMTGQVLKRGFADEYEKEYLRRDGTSLPVSVRVWLVRDEQGQPSRMWRITRDISERRRMEESLRASERELRTIVEKLPVGVWLTDAAGRVILCNPAGELIWGGSRFTGIEQYGQYTGWWHGTGRRIEPHEWGPVRALTRGETYVNEVIDIETLDGSRKTISHSALPVRDDANRITGIVVIHEDITERKRAEQRLRESDERHRRITQALSDYVYTVWVEAGRVVRTEHGAACEAVTGYTRDDFSSNPYLWLRMVVDEDRPLVLERSQKLLAGQAVPPLEHRIVRKDGAVLWVRNTAVPQFDAQGRMLCYDGVVQDITERKAAQESLLAERRLFMGGPTVAFTWKAAEGWPVEYVSPNFQDQFGYAPGEFLSGTTVYAAIVHPDDLARITAEVHAFSADGRATFAQEYRVRRADGAYRWVSDFTAVVRDPGGRVVQYHGYVNDITERKQAEAALQASEAKFRIVADNTCDWEFWIAPAGEFHYVSPSCRRVTGHGPEEFAGDPQMLDRIMHPEDRPRFAAHRRDEVEGKRPGALEFRIMRPDGTVRWISHVCQPVCDGEGRFLGSRGSNRDVTERREAEDSLRFIQFAVDHCSLPAYWMDAQARILYANEAAGRSLGYTAEEFLGLRVFDLDPRAKPDSWESFWAELKARRSITMESCQRTKDGRVFPTEIHSSYLERGGTERCFSFVQDITERKRAEEAQGS